MATNLDDRVPHDEKAEKAVLASILIDPDAVLRARQVGLEATDFWNPRCAWVYQAASDLAMRIEPVTAVAIADLLAERRNGGQSQLQAISGGLAKLVGLMAEEVNSQFIEQYANIVRRLAQKRRLIDAAGRIAALAYDADGPMDTITSDAMRIFLAATERTEDRSHLYGTDDALIAYLSGQQRRAERDPDRAIKTHLPDLDRLLGDIPGGMLHVVIARSSVGKTLYMEHVAEENAKRGHRVAFFHLELSHEVMLDRLVARYSRIAVGRLRAGYNGPEVARAIDAISPWWKNMCYVKCPGWSAEQIALDAQRLYARGECDLIIVDYLQKMPLPTKHPGLNGAMLVGQQAEVLKTVAENLNVPVILGAQVSRDYKQREDKRPHLEDLRNSGEIEEKCNQAVVLHRPGERVEVGEMETLELALEKNTQGPCGTIRVGHWVGSYRLVSMM